MNPLELPLHLRLLIKMSWEKGMYEQNELKKMFLNQLMLFQDQRRSRRKCVLPR